MGGGDQVSAPRVNRIALVDMDSCFASCERIFHPDLEGRAVVVLSNNDGCVVAMSKEAKTLGIEMGVPWFKIRTWAQRNGVIARSSNYELYGSISARVMGLLGQIAATVEVYSIDEAFLHLHEEPAEIVQIGRHIRDQVRQCVGVPVSVGIAPTRTLAKLAARGAKRSPGRAGVASTDQYTPAQLEAILDATPVGDLWGVGPRLERRLAGMGITTALQLRAADPNIIRRKFSVVLARTVHELRGESCIEITHRDAERTGQLMFSRSFSTPVTTTSDLHQVLSIYAQNVTRRLRRQKTLAGAIWAFASTSWHTEPVHRISATAEIDPRTDSPVTVLQAVSERLLPQLVPGHRYVRAGISLSDLAPTTSQEMLPGFTPNRNGTELGALVDRVNAAVGRNTVGLGLAGIKTPPDWQMRRDMLSNRATTHWSELATVTAC